MEEWRGMKCGGEDGWRDGWEGAVLVGLRDGGYREMEGTVGGATEGMEGPRYGWVGKWRNR